MREEAAREGRAGDVLDVEWILTSDKELKGARLLVAFGGLNIWIDTLTVSLRAIGGVRRTQSRVKTSSD